LRIGCNWLKGTSLKDEFISQQFSLGLGEADPEPASPASKKQNQKQLEREFIIKSTVLFEFC